MLVNFRLDVGSFVLSRVYFICVSMCKYECVRRAAKRLNFREVTDEEDWNIYWTDSGVGLERVSQMKKWQVEHPHFVWLDEKRIVALFFRST